MDIFDSIAKKIAEKTEGLGAEDIRPMLEWLEQK